MSSKGTAASIPLYKITIASHGVVFCGGCITNSNSRKESSFELLKVESLMSQSTSVRMRRLLVTGWVLNLVMRTVKCCGCHLVLRMGFMY